MVQVQSGTGEVKGTITRVEQEWAGTKLEIESDEYPAFRNRGLNAPCID